MPTPVTVQRFPGLDLRDDPAEAGAIGMFNVDLDRLGRVRSRYGFAQFDLTAVGGTHVDLIGVSGDRLYAASVGVASSTVVDKYDSAGTKTNIGTTGGGTVVTQDLVSLGTPTSTLIFLSGIGSTMQKVSGGALASSVGKPGFLAVTPWDNRLVQGAFSAAADSPTGANGSLHTVAFSDAGAPETYGANNYVHLRPGDNEQILGMVTWRDYVFVFKQTAMFVFYGTSTDGTGNPIFNYRRIDLPHLYSGVPATVPIRIVAANRHGVFFAARDGIYRTTGDTPVKISGPIDTIYRQAAGDFNLVDLVSLSATDSRLFVNYTADVADHVTLVYDCEFDIWMAWGLDPSGAVKQIVQAPLLTSAGEPHALWFIDVSSPTHIMKMSSAATTDNGSNIASYYQSGWSDFGSPYDKRLTDLALWGTGTPTVSIFTDRGSTDANAAAVTLGTSPAVARGVRRTGTNGRQFSWKVSSTSGAWLVSSLEAYLADERQIV